MVPKDGDVAAKAKELLAAGHSLIIADLEAADLLAVADLPEAKSAVILDIRTNDDALRQEQCRANVFHIRPNWAMRADALAQYLVWKKWRRWFLIVGKSPADQGYAAAVRRAAARFGGKIVGEAPYSFEAGSRRTDTGHQQIQTQMPMLTQGVPEHDVVIVADEVRRLRRLHAVPHRRAASRRRDAGAGGCRLAPRLRGVRRHADAEPLREEGRPHHDRARLHGVACRAHRRRGGRAHRPQRCRLRARLHPLRQVRGGGLQGPGHELQVLGSAAAPADPARRPARARLDLAAGGVPASEIPHRHPRLRCAGEQVPPARIHPPQGASDAPRPQGTPLGRAGFADAVEPSGCGLDDLRQQREGQHGHRARQREPEGDQDDPGRQAPARHRHLARLQGGDGLRRRRQPARRHRHR